MADPTTETLRPVVADDRGRITAELIGSGRTDPFVAAVRATRMPIIVSDPRAPDNPVVFANDAFCQMTGYGRDEIVGRNCRFLQGPETDPETVHRIRAAVADARPIEIDIRNYRKSGEGFWNRLLLEPVRDTDGVLAYFCASQVDVTLERERLADLENSNAALMAEIAGRLRAHQDSERRLRFVIQAGRLGFFEIDTVSGELTSSPVCRENFGRDPASPFSHADLRACVHPDDRDRMVDAIERSIARGTDYDVEVRLHRPDGAVGWIQMRGQLAPAGNGTRACIVGISLDVTPRHLAEEERRLADTLLRTIIETSPGLIFAKDRQGRMMIANSATLGLIGKSWSEVKRRTDREFLDDPEQAGIVMRNDQRVMDAGHTVELEEIVGVADGAPRVWLSTKTPLRDASGAIGGLVGVSVDITGRKRSEAELQQLNASLEARVAERTAERDRAWKNSQDLLAVVDLDGTFRAANPAWSSILGWGSDDVIGRHFLDFTHPDDRAASDAAYRLAAANNMPPHDNRIRHRDGSYRWIAWVAALEGSLIYGSGRNVTAEKEGAAALARTEELLRQSQKMEAVGQLTGGIAHDFNNLLAAITGSLELLQRRVDAGRTDDLERYTAAAITAARRAASLTQRLLAFARRQPLDPRRTDANRLVAGMEDLVRRTMGPGVAFEMVLSDGLWPTLCDPNQLENAILNLAINARDAMQGGGRLTIETANAHLDDAYARSQAGDVKPGQYIMISVSDTGTGMEPEIIARAFDPFFTTKPIGQGTGLGLSMLYGFIKQSGGHVRIHSQAGQGTTFKLYLPRDRGRAEDAGADTALVEALPQAERGETVLVVDDEATIRMLVTETLEELGYAAIEACDGPSALRILQGDDRIDLLVTDVGLPGLNGRQLADAARVPRPSLPVLFITGYAHNAAIGNGALEPGMEIVTKPFALDTLASKIRSMIEAGASVTRPRAP